MKLKSIKAYGFKSFADKIDIEIKSNITAIVGPNGSGKSNIVDAVRWVLGEQSVKSLRGSGAMTDCIFAGSKTRDPLKRAEVSLTFDNQDHYLNSDLNEIEIKRVVYQTGENEYFLNNAKVRLKDITNLFLDSGAGIDSFNIISQGSIESIVNSKPEDRRVIVEEAAGVLKYKKRKEESLRKLEKTKDNLEKVGLIINELEVSVLPLKEQSEIAQKYLNLKKELEKLEVAFIATDIKTINEQYQVLKQEVAALEQEVLNLSTTSSEDNSKLELLRLENMQLEEKINNKNNELLEITSNIAEKNSEKEITLERQKYSISKESVNETLLLEKEEILNLEKQSELLRLEIDSLTKELQHHENEFRDIEERISLNQVKKKNGEVKKNNLTRELWESKNRREIVENNIQNDLKVPVSVKNVLNNPRLSGIHGTIGKLIEVEEKYLNAIDTALGASANFIVVENEENAKHAIQFLKENRLGRATFFPRNIIKSRNIDFNVIKDLKKEEGFLGIASDLVQYDKNFQNIIENQLGNIIVVDTIDTLNQIGRKTNYRYRIVSLDGEILHSGGSMTGGSLKKSNTSLSDTLELDQLKVKEKNLENDINQYQSELVRIDIVIQKDLLEGQKIQQQILKKQEEIKLKKESLEGIEKNYSSKKKEIEGINHLLESSLDTQLIHLLEEIKELEKQSEIVKKELEQAKNRKSEVTSEIANYEQIYRQKNSDYNKLEQECKQKEIQLGKMDIRLDNLLVTLSDNYNLTFEKAYATYPLEIEYSLAKERVERLKKEMNSLGNVNLGSIEEYERLSTRYNFLLEQKNDLENASNNLLDVISEMDEIMITRFKETFQKISQEFRQVFSKLFKGGNGILKMTDPEHILETGIEIIAEPPGKKLNNIALLSGGEKTLTAIALLFAILNIKPVPFCILDEVEAALDEANVDTFGHYLQSQKEKSEFILITHKKRTMEYADTLYGITMQESGVSKIVSVELENI